jgi:hypothetical protein
MERYSDSSEYARQFEALPDAYLAKHESAIEYAISQQPSHDVLPAVASGTRSAIMKQIRATAEPQLIPSETVFSDRYNILYELILRLNAGKNAQLSSAAYQAIMSKPQGLTELASFIWGHPGKVILEPVDAMDFKLRVKARGQDLVKEYSATLETKDTTIEITSDDFYMLRSSKSVIASLAALLNQDGHRVRFTESADQEELIALADTLQIKLEPISDVRLIEDEPAEHLEGNVHEPLEPQNASTVLAFIEEELQNKNTITVSNDEYKILTSTDNDVTRLLLLLWKYPHRILLDDRQKEDIKKRAYKNSLTAMEHVRERLLATPEPVTITTEELQLIHISRRNLETLAGLLNAYPSRVRFASATDEKDIKKVMAKIGISLQNDPTVSATPTSPKEESAHEAFVEKISTAEGLLEVTQQRWEKKDSVNLTPEQEAILKGRLATASREALAAVRERLQNTGNQRVVITRKEFLLIKSSITCIHKLQEALVKYRNIAVFEFEDDARMQHALAQNLQRRTRRNIQQEKPHASNVHAVVYPELQEGSALHGYIEALEEGNITLANADCEKILADPARDELYRFLDIWNDNPNLVRFENPAYAKVFEMKLEQLDNDQTVIGNR